MKELKNLEAIRELLASHPIYTYDYTDGLHINKEATNIQVYSIDLGDDPLAAYISGYIIIYPSEEVLFENLRENIISHMESNHRDIHADLEILQQLAVSELLNQINK